MTTGTDEHAGPREQPAVLVTKLHPPVVPAQAVRRASGSSTASRRPRAPAQPGRLPGRLRQVHAARGLAGGRGGRPPGGLGHLDEGDDDAVVLWSHVDRGAGARVPGPARRRAGDDGDRRTAARGAAAAARQRRSPSRATLVLVLDDFHRLSSAAARESVAWFVDHVPATTQVVLATRADPALPLGALRARGHLLELRADDLRFTVRRGGGVPQRPARARAARGGRRVCSSRAPRAGPPALYLAALSLEGKADKAALVRAFDGTSAHVVDFLSSEVLAGYDPELQAFMLRTSPLERLCAELCDAVLGTARFGGGPRAARAQQPLPAPARRPRARWFRFHHLFAQLLRVELARREPRAGRRLHRRAAAWHAALGHDGRGGPPRARRRRVRRGRALVAGAWVHYVNAGRTSPSSTGCPLPGRGRRRRRAAAARPGVGLRAAGPRARHAPRDRARRASAATSRTGRCPTGSRRSPRASACCGPRSAGATSA